MGITDLVLGSLADQHGWVVGREGVLVVLAEVGGGVSCAGDEHEGSERLNQLLFCMETLGNSLKDRTSVLSKILQ